MSLRMKKVCWVTAFVIVSAVVLVMCVTYFRGSQIIEFDGTLV